MSYEYDSGVYSVAGVRWKRNSTTAAPAARARAARRNHIRFLFFCIFSPVVLPSAVIVAYDFIIKGVYNIRIWEFIKFS